MKYILVLFFLCFNAEASKIDLKKGTEIQNYEVDNIEDEKAKEGMQKWIKKDFGLRPHKVNYLLPFGYRSGNYKSYVQTDEYRNIEAELQVSLKLYLGTNLLGLEESYYLAYSHKAFWQVYAESSPFRETNYTPEAFVEFPVNNRDSYFNMRSIKLGLAHTSNGQGNNKGVIYTDPSKDPGNRSREINYIYTELSFQHNTLITELKLYSSILESSDNGNPDIMDYIGYSSIKFSYFKGDNLFTLMGRANFATGFGAIEATYSYPLIDNAYFYAKVFSGYAESLIDYNNDITKFSVGFSFSR